MLARSSSMTAAGVLAVTLAACEPAEKVELMTTQQPLIVQPEAELYAVGDFPLKVCFRPDNGNDEGDGTPAQRAEVRARVEKAWEGLPRSAIGFTGWETCVSEDDSAFKINLDSSVDNGLYRWAAKSMRLPIGSTNRYIYATIHEFGHALGIVHEQAHPDKPDTCGHDESLPSDDIVLTEYDPDAVMNYCAPPNPTELTDREKLFAEMTYPTDTTNHPVRASTAYLGRALVVRSTATLETDWTFRGALPAAYNQLQWFVDGIPVTAVSIPAASIAPGGTGSATLDYAFEDFRGESHSSETRTVTVSNSLHAAITTTML
jgi:hypothetical protein